MPLGASVTNGSLFLRHFAEEVIAFITKHTGISSDDFLLLAAETSFLALSDTPDAYDSASRRPIRGNAGTDGDANGLEFAMDSDLVLRCDYATTANVNLASPPSTVDGGTPAVGALIVVKNNTTTTENGVYVKGVSGWTRYSMRAEDWQVVRVCMGTTNAGSLWEVIWDGEINVGTDPIAFRKLNASTGITGSGTTSVIPYWTSSSSQGNTDMLFNNSDNLYGIGGASTTAKVRIVHAGGFVGFEIDYSGSNSAQYIKQSGSGRASKQEITNASNVQPVNEISGNHLGHGQVITLSTPTGGSGYAGFWKQSGVGNGTFSYIESSTNANDSHTAQTAGTGRSIYGKNTNTGNTSPTARLEHAGAGPAISFQGGLQADLVSFFNAGGTLSTVHFHVLISTTTTAFTINLPALSAVNEGHIWFIRDVGNTLSTRSVTLQRNGTDTFLDGATSTVLGAAGAGQNRAMWILHIVKDTAGARKWAISRIAYGA